MEWKFRLDFDPTIDRQKNTKSTFSTIFPAYLPKMAQTKSIASTAYGVPVDANEDPDYIVHNTDLAKKMYNKKVDRYVLYNEAMLQVKNMRGRK